MRLRRSAWSGDDRQAGIAVGLGAGPGQRLRVRLDRGQRRLEVVADAAEEVVLDVAQAAELGVLLLDLGEQLGIADGDPDLAGVQVEEGLVGALPGPGGGQAREEQAHPLVAGAEFGADRDRDAGDALFWVDGVGVDEDDHGGDEAERRLGVAGGALGHRVDAVARLGRFDGGEDEPELAVAPVGIAGEAVVTLRELGEDVVALDRDRAGHVAGRDPGDGRRDLAQRRHEAHADDGPAEDADDDRGREHEQEEADPDLRLDRAGHDEQGPEEGERDDRRDQEGQRQPRLKGEVEPAPASVRGLRARTGSGRSGGVGDRCAVGRAGHGPSLRVGMRSRSGVMPRGGSRSRGRSRGGAGGSGPPRASGGGAAS